MRPHRSTAASTIRCGASSDGEVDGQRRDTRRDRRSPSPVRPAGPASRPVPSTAMPGLGELDRASETDTAAGARHDRYLHVTPPSSASLGSDASRPCPRRSSAMRPRSTTCSGILNFATPRPRAGPRRSARSGSRRSDATMTAHARSPVRGSGTPTTATSAMSGMADEDVLDLLRRDVLAVADDDVLGSAGDHEVVVVEPAAEVAGAEVAVLVEGVGVVLGVQVAHQHLRSARPDLAVDAV